MTEPAKTLIINGNTYQLVEEEKKPFRRKYFIKFIKEDDPYIMSWTCPKYEQVSKAGYNLTHGFNAVELKEGEKIVDEKTLKKELMSLLVADTNPNELPRQLWCNL